MNGSGGSVAIFNRHERVVAGSPRQIALILVHLDAVWPTELGPAPRPLGNNLYDAPPMVWEEFATPGAIRAFRVVHPAGLQAEHWFEARQARAGTLVRHTAEGRARSTFRNTWQEQIEPRHDLVLEALLDNIEAAFGRRLPGVATGVWLDARTLRSHRPTERRAA